MELSRNDRSLRTAAWQSVCYSSECYMHDPTIVAALFLRDDGLVNFDNLCVARMSQGSRGPPPVGAAR